MTQDLISDLRSRINPQYADRRGTESYERRICAEALEAQADEIKRLESMLDKLSTWTGGGIEVSLDAWKAADKDAKRYRWLRENCDWTKGGMVFTHIENVRLGSMCPSLELLDECVDRKLSAAALTKAVEISQENKLP